MRRNGAKRSGEGGSILPKTSGLMFAVAIAAVLVGLTLTATAQPRPAPIDVTGHYDSNWGYVYLEQAEYKVWGRYKCCGGGLLRGVIRGNVLYYEWTQPGASGRGRWVIVGKQLRGPWGFGGSEINGGPWNLVRKPPLRSNPAPPPPSGIPGRG